MPVKNGFVNKTEKNINLSKSLNSILNQSYNNLEVIISNSHSTDETQTFIEKAAKSDKRIKIFNHSDQISGAQNFEFVLKSATGKYFKWQAQDDEISLDFIDKNFIFLENNQDYICSSSKFYWEDNIEQVYSVDLNEDLYTRVKKFFNIRFCSHNIYYGLMRREPIAKTKYLSRDYLAFDWMFDFELLMRGKFKTIDDGHMILGSKGVSKLPNFLKEKRFNEKKIYRFLPFYEMTKDLINETIFSNKLSNFQKISIYFSCLKANLSFVKRMYENKNYTKI